MEKTLRIGIMGALVFTIIGAAALLPVGEEVGEFIAVMIIPILMILVATILYMIRYNVEKWVLYSFYIVAILAVVGIVLSIIDFINEYGGEAIMCKTGHGFIKGKMKETKYLS